MTGWSARRIGEPGKGGVGVTVYCADSGRPGPRLLVLAGVHGDEIASIVGAGRLTTEDIPLEAGAVEIVPVVHEAANLRFQRTGPDDGLDLARTFPGDAHGSPTQRLAALVLDRLFGHADAVIDLHTSAQDADLPLFAGALFDGTAVGRASARMAAAFAAGIVWTHPAVAPGRTLTMANRLGIPAMYVESPNGGVLASDVIDLYSAGVLRVCAALGMLSADAPPLGAELRLWMHGAGDTDSFASASFSGYFVAEAALLQPVAAGDAVGRVIDARGALLERIRAPVDGVVSFLRRRAPVSSGTPLVSFADARPLASFLTLTLEPSEGDLQ